MIQLHKIVVCLVVAVSCVAFAQIGRAEQKTLPRIAIVFPQSPGFDRPLREQLIARGFVEGKNVNLDWRSYKTWDATMESMIAELIQSAPDVIVVAGTPATRAVLRQTKTIPVVFDVGDPLATGLVSSLSHPDRNATGVSTTSVEGSAKVFELVTQLVPGARRILIVRNTLNPLAVKMVEQIRTLATPLQVQLKVLDARDPDELVSGLRKVDRRHADAILIPTDLVFQTGRERIVLAVRNTGLPAVYQEHGFAKAGGLLSYGPDPEEVARSASNLVLKILQGAKPSELPVEQVTKLRLLVNVRTAKEMDIIVPESVLTRADEVLK